MNTTPLTAPINTLPATKPPRKKPRRPHLSSLSDDPLAGFLTNPTFTMHERAIYMVIRSYANAAGEARLQQATISETTRYSSRYVRRLLQSLRAKSALAWERKQYCNCYTLLM